MRTLDVHSGTDGCTNLQEYESIEHAKTNVVLIKYKQHTLPV